MPGRWIVLPFMLVAGGCSSYRVVGPMPSPATPIRVSFLSPRDVVARTPAGESLLLSNVREIRGTVVFARRDTMHVRIASAQTASGRLNGIADGTVAAVPREVFVRIEEKAFDGGKTAGVAGRVALGVLLGALLLALAVVSALPDA